MSTRRTRTLAVVASDRPRLLDLAVSDLVDHPRNVRRDVGDVTELAASITERGVLEPLLVAPWEDPDGAHYVVIAGHRRLAGARLACIPTVPCIVRGDLVDDVDVITAMLMENLQRTDLTPVEEGTAYQQLALAGLDPDAIAQRTGRSAQTVRSRIRLMDLPESTRDRIHARQITLEQASDLAALADTDVDPGLYAQLEEAAGTHDWPFEHHRITAIVERQALLTQNRAQLAADGIRMVTPKSDAERWRMHLGYALHGSYGRPSPEDVAGHATCPGHAALDPQWGQQPASEITWLCTEPGQHAPAAAPGSPDLDALNEANPSLGHPVDPAALAAYDAQIAAERAAREAEWRDLFDHAKAAQAARWDWVKGYVTTKAKAPAKHATAIAGYVAGLAVRHLEPELDDWVTLFGVDAGELAYEEVTARLEQETTNRDPHRMLLALAASCGEASDAGHASSWSAGKTAAHVLPWLDLLAALGWVPSTWEADRIAAGRTALAEDLARDTAGRRTVKDIQVAGGVL